MEISNRKKQKKSIAIILIVCFVICTPIMYMEYFHETPLKIDDITLKVNRFIDNTICIQVEIKDKNYAMTNWHFKRKGNACYITAKKIPYSLLNKTQNHEYRISMLLYDYAFFDNIKIWERPYR